MRIVPRPEWAPHQCAVTMRTEDPEGFVDTGNSLPVIDPRIYVSVAGVRAMARLIGLEDPTGRDEQITLLQERVAELEDQVAEADRFREAAEYTLQRFGQPVKRKPGRKPNKKVAA